MFFFKKKNLHTNYYANATLMLRLFIGYMSRNSRAIVPTATIFYQSAERVDEAQLWSRHRPESPANFPDIRVQIL